MCKYMCIYIYTSGCAFMCVYIYYIQSRSNQLSEDVVGRSGRFRFWGSGLKEQKTQAGTVEATLDYG